MPNYDDLAADMAGSIKQQNAQAGSATLYTAADTNPDAEAGLLKLSKRTGIPAEALRLDNAKRDAERQDRANQYDTLLKSSPATAKWIADLDNARLAHDDTASLSMLETGLGKLKNAGRAVLGGVSGFNEGFYGLAQIPAEAAQAAAQPLVGSLLPENPFTRMTEAIKARRQYEGATTKSLLDNPNAGPTERGIYSGIQSLTQNLMTLPLAVVSGNPELTLYPMAGQTGGQAYGQARDKGVSIPGSLSFGTSQAVIEYATEKIPVGRFLDDLAKNTGFTKMIAGQLASEIPGEQVATLLQDLNEWAVLNPEKPFKDYLAERPGAAYETLVATIVGTGGNVAIGKAGQAVANRAQSAMQAQTDAKTVADLMTEAGKNKLRTRAPESFAQFVQQAAEHSGATPTEVYISAKDFQAALHQDGVDQVEIIAAMPSVAQQLDEALASGGDLVVPISEMLTAIPGTAMEQSVINHVRTQPDAMSLAESQDAQANQAEYFQQEADKILAEQADSKALQEKSDAVYEDVLTQLNAAGRFTTDVNTAYAEFMRNFFITLANRTGQDINAVYAQYKPTIGAQLPGMDALAKGGLDQTMYRGVGEGSSTSGTITWMSPDKSIADSYSAFRGGETQQIEHTPQKVFDAGRDENTLTAKQFTARALSQAAKLGTVDKAAALAARDAFLQGVDSTTADKVTAFWSSEQNAAKTADFLQALGFDTIRLDERGIETFGAIRKAHPQQLNQSATSYTADTIEVDGVTRPAKNSNGQPIAQTEEGLRNFWKWFGDSKVVDSEGRPLVVYHGTTADFTEFKPESHFGTQKQAQDILRTQERIGEGTPAVMPVYLSLQNPMRVEDDTGVNWAEVAKDAKQQGHDGLVYQNWGEFDPDAEGNPRDSYIAFNPTQIKSAVGNSGAFDPANPSILAQNPDSPRGAFVPANLSITLLQSADLTTFLHESAHYFLTVYERIAAQPNAPEGVAQDMDALLKWIGVQPTESQSRIDVWTGMTLDEQRKGHEQFAESFEQWLFSGKAPNTEIQGLFERFRSWMLRTYESLRKFSATHRNAKLNPEIEQVFSRMLASEDQIKAAEQFRSMQPIFSTPEQAGMTAEQFAEYQNQGREATAEGNQQLAMRSLRDMQWLSNAKSKALRALQKEANALRAEVRMDVRREVMRQPIYRAWQFLTGSDPTISAKIAKAKADTNLVDPSTDSLFAAIGKLGGIKKEQAVAEWGVDLKDKPQSGVFGKPVLRSTGGLTLDGMVEELAQYGYLETDENGKAYITQLEEAFAAESRGDYVYSLWHNYGDQFEPQAYIDLENQRSGRIARADAQTAYGAGSQITQTLEKHRMLSNGGDPADAVAEAFGFSSGDELMRALADAEPPKEAIDALTDQRMLERHGEIATPDALERAAEAAIHNRARAKFVATEYAALTKQLGKVSEIRKAARQYAESIVARTRVLDLKPNRYAAAEARAAKAAETAQRKSERDKVVTEKRNQMLNNATAKAMHDARDEAKGIAEYLQKFDKESTRKGLDAEFVDQIDSLLAKFDLRTSTSATAIEKRETLKTFVMRQLKAGELPDLAESLLSPAERARYKAQVESRDADGDLIYADDEERIKLLADAIDNSATRSYKEMTMEELRGLRDTVRQIEHLGRMKHKLLTAADQAEYEAARDTIANTIINNAKNSGKNTRTANDWLGRKLEGIKQFGAAHIKVATWARIMDGGQDNGAVWRYLIRPANERATMETTMRAEATKALDDIIRPLLSKVPMSDKVGKGKYFQSIGESLNWQERFALALNTGNEGNLQRLLDGRGWTMQQIMPVLNSLTAKEWQAVQAVWDHFETYRPMIAEKERRVTGSEPKWIDARQMQVRTADGQELTLRGGYYPVVYDPRTNMKAQQHTAAEDAKNAMKAAYSAATTRRSFTKERAESVKGRPLLLNMQGLYGGVNDVIHDLAWHEWVLDANKLLRSKTIDQAMREHYGPEVKREFEKWRDDIVAGTRRLDHAIEKAAGWARQGVSASGLTFNVMSAAMQPLGLTQSIVRVGPQWIGKGLAKYVAAPIETTKEVNEKSEWMQNRARTRFRELNELRNQVQGQTAFKEWLGKYGYFFMMRAQQMVDVPTWWGAYEKAIAQGVGEDTAVAIADQAVKDSQGGGEEVDQSGVERGGPLIKLFTVFYSFMNTAANLGYAEAKTESGKAKLAAKLLLLYSVPAVLGSLLRDALTPGDAGDDDEELAKKMISEQIGYLMGLVAFGREFAQVGKVMTGQDKGQGYSGPAGLRVIPDSVALAKQAKQGEFDDAFRKAAINLTGDLFGLPAAQINRSITGAEALADNKTSNPAALVMGYQEKKK